MTDEIGEEYNLDSITDLSIKLEYLTWFCSHNDLEVQNLSCYGKDRLNGDR